MSENTKIVTNHLKVDEIKLVTYYDKVNGKYNITNNELIIPLQNLKEFATQLLSLCNKLEQTGNDFNIADSPKANPIDILNAINQVDEKRKAVPACDGKCEGCGCKKELLDETDLFKSKTLSQKAQIHEAKTSPVKHTTGLSGISDWTPSKTANDEYQFSNNYPKIDFSPILSALQKYVMKKNSAVTLRQVSKAFYDRTRKFCKANGISEEGFTMLDWKDLFNNSANEISNKYGMVLTGNDTIVYNSIFKYTKPTGGLSG